MSAVPPIVITFDDESTKKYEPNLRDIVEFERAFNKSFDDLMSKDATPHLDWILYIAHSVAKRGGESTEYLEWIEGIQTIGFEEDTSVPLDQEP